MNLTLLAFRHQRVLCLTTALIMLYGLFSYFHMSNSEDPIVIVREAVITTEYPGLPAEQVEENITKPLEASIHSIGELEGTYSTSMHGRSIIHVHIQDRYYELDQIWDKLHKKVEDTQPLLPEGTHPSFINDDTGDVAVVSVALTSDVFSHAEQGQMAEHIRTALYAVPGTKKIELFGAQEQRVFVDISEAQLAELDMSPVNIANQLQSRNIYPPGGVLETRNQRLALEVSGEFKSIDDIANAEIRLPGGDNLRLQDLGEIYRGYQDPAKRTAYFNGKQAIIFAIYMLDGENVVTYGDDVLEILDQLRKNLPAGYDLDIVDFQPEQVSATIFGVTINLIQALVVVLAVVLIFLGTRTGLIVGSVVPITMLVSLAVMAVSEVTLQRASLATLVVALGMLVDNAIVIAEDFKTRLQAGLNPDQVLKETGSELAMPLLSSTLTTILMYLPLMLAQHVAGEYSRSISQVITITLLISWFLSLTLIPVLCHRFLTTTSSPDESVVKIDNSTRFSDHLLEWMSVRYARLLRSLLHHRAWFLIATIVTLLAGTAMMQLVPNKFFPDSNRSQVLVIVNFPSDSSEGATNRRMQELSQDLREANDVKDDITSVTAFAGFGGMRFVLPLTPIDPSPNKGFMIINVSSPERVESFIKTLRTHFSNLYPDILAQVTRLSLGPSGTVLKIQVKGPDREVLYETASKIEAKLANIEGSVDVHDNWEVRIPTLNIEVNQAWARNTGISSKDIAESLQGAVDGYHLTNYRENGDIIPVVIRLPEEKRSSITYLESLMVYPIDPPGKGVPLNQVAEVSLDRGYFQIGHENMVRTISIVGQNQYLAPEELMPIITPSLKKLEEDLPAGHWIEFDGVVVDAVEAKNALQEHLPLCLGLIFILLSAQFNSFRRPILILFTIPLMITGVSLGLLIMRADFGFMVLLGLYSLAGIIINNAIVLIDRIEIERHQVTNDTDACEAVIKASTRRLRPILMAAITTILGFLPLIANHDPLFYGMASAMAFGLGVGTIMSLFVVPVLYTWLFNIDTRISTDQSSLSDTRFME